MTTAMVEGAKGEMREAQMTGWVGEKVILIQRMKVHRPEGSSALVL
jgi:hypothetical protein